MNISNLDFINDIKGKSVSGGRLLIEGSGKYWKFGNGEVQEGTGDFSHASDEHTKGWAFVKSTGSGTAYAQVSITASA